MKLCLLLVDIQNDYFPEGILELHGMVNAANNAKSLLQFFRMKKMQIIHIKHISIRPGSTFFLPNTEGVEINNLVKPEEGEVVVEKNYPNSFRETGLLDLLKMNEIEGVVICGAMSHMCIDATTRAAFDYGFNCYVAEDACATRNLQFRDTIITADEVHASFMAALSVPYAQVLQTVEMIRLFE